MMNKIKKSQLAILGTIFLTVLLIFASYNSSFRATAQPSPEISQRLDASQPSESTSTNNDALNQFILEDPENDLLLFQQGLNDYQQAQRLRQNAQNQAADTLLDQAIAKISRAIKLNPESWMYWFRKQVREPSLKNATVHLRAGRDLCRGGGRQTIAARELDQAFQNFISIKKISLDDRSICKAEINLYRKYCQVPGKNSFRNCASRCLKESSTDACTKRSKSMAEAFK
ncbi:hypothetical protein ACKFKG_33170 [Phormidesmis sp. 146-35]